MNYTTSSVFQPSIHMPGNFETLSGEFIKYHQDPTNVLLHLITTPLGFIGALSIFRKVFNSSSPAVTLCGVYLLSLLPEVSNGILAGTTLLCIFVILASRYLKLNFFVALAFVIAGYFLQDIAHTMTGEKTFQSTYSAGGQIDMNNLPYWSKMFGQHVYYLLPLIVYAAQPFCNIPPQIKVWLDAPAPEFFHRFHAASWLLGPLVLFVVGSYSIDSKNCFCFFPGAPYYERIIRTNVAFPKEGESRKQDLKTVRDFAMEQRPPEESSSHFWFSELPEGPRNAFSRVARASQILKMFTELFSDEHYYVAPIDGMNEIYITGPSRFDEASNSDQVFYTRHVDGPWGLIPFVSVFRCLVGMDRNKMITTHFPIAGHSTNTCEGDAIAFDYNREIHYITRDDSKREISDKFRVTLKLHYIIYPRILAPLGWLMASINTNYNMTFRALFLKTINPTNFYERFLAWNVNFQTNLFDFIETYVGQRNFFYLGLCASIWYITGSYEVFFAMTSFVHYFRYITTYYVRDGLDFGAFKRDALLFKSISLAQLFFHYFFPANHAFEFDAVSLGLMAFGFLISTMAAGALGMDATYFGVELGVCEPKLVTKFPYGVIPHPMIVGQIVGLLGIHKAAHFRSEWPDVVPVHIFLYFVHMMQEQLDIHGSKKHLGYKTVAKSKAQ